MGMIVNREVHDRAHDDQTTGSENPMDFFHGLDRPLHVLECIEQEDCPDTTGVDTDIVKVENLIDSRSLTHVTADIVFAREVLTKVRESLLPRHLE